MKEVTYEDWMKNPRPRWMWCWDSDEKIKGKGYVLCILNEKEMLETGTEYPVRTMSGSCYCNCAEIEEPTRRPCTREELVEMLKKQELPILTFKDSGYLYNVARITDGDVMFISIAGVISYSYKELCTQFTLIDGTSLWVEE